VQNIVCGGEAPPGNPVPMFEANLVRSQLRPSPESIWSRFPETLASLKAGGAEVSLGCWASG